MSDNNKLLLLWAISVDHWNHRGYEVIVDYNKEFKGQHRHTQDTLW